MISLRKIGGLYWLRLGRLRVAFCICAKPRPADPIRQAAAQLWLPSPLPRRRL